MSDNRIIVQEVPEFRRDFEDEVQAHHAMIDLGYDLNDPYLFPCERAELQARVNAAVLKLREGLR